MCLPTKTGQSHKFVLPMVSLIPHESAARLRQLFGPDFELLTHIEVQTLVTADLEGGVSNARLQLLRSEHPVELTRILQGLAARGFLDQVGQKRGCIYRLPGWATALVPGATALAPGATALAAGAPALAPDEDMRLLAIAKPARDKKKLITSLTQYIIRQLCEGRYLTAEQIGSLMDRGKDKLQKNFLAEMVQTKELELLFPDQPTHPEQAYRTRAD